jgi:hypothetical protein
VGRIRNTTERVAKSSAGQPQEAPPPPAAEATPAQENGVGSLTKIADQITAVVPKAEDIAAVYSATKGKTKDFLNQYVSAIYGMQAMLRFSMAIVGCPVSVSAENPDPETMDGTLNGVKVLLFPAAREQAIRIEATGDGMLSATVYRPASMDGDSRVNRFHLRGPVRKSETWCIRVPMGEPIRIEGPKAFPGSDQAHRVGKACDD